MEWKSAAIALASPRRDDAAWTAKANAGWIEVQLRFWVGNRGAEKNGHAAKDTDLVTTLVLAYADSTLLVPMAVLPDWGPTWD